MIHLTDSFKHTVLFNPISLAKQTPPLNLAVKM